MKTRALTIGLFLVSLPMAAHTAACPPGTVEKRVTTNWSRESWCALEDEHGSRKHGPYLLETLDGRPSIQGRYDNGSKVGTWRAWNGQGVLETEASYKTGRPHGLQRRFFSSGQTWLEEHYEKGVLHGAFRAWHENGQLWQTGHYEAGRETGRWTRWHENGVKAADGHVTQGKRSHDWTRWDSSGSMISGGLGDDSGSVRAKRRLGPIEIHSLREL